MDEREGVYIAAAVRAAFKNAIVDPECGLVRRVPLQRQKDIFRAAVRAPECVAFKEQAQIVRKGPLYAEIDEGYHTEVAAPGKSGFSHQGYVRAAHLGGESCPERYGIIAEKLPLITQAIRIKAIDRFNLFIVGEGDSVEGNRLRKSSRSPEAQGRCEEPYPVLFGHGIPGLHPDYQYHTGGGFIVERKFSSRVRGNPYIVISGHDGAGFNVGKELSENRGYGNQ